jgi:predicted nucleotidyltransferase
MDVMLARWGGLNIDKKKLMRIEKKKILHGITQETDYFIRLIWQPKNLLNEKYSKPLKKIELTTKIKSDKFNFFTPCIYGIREDYSYNDEKNVEISQIISFRGRFTEQAWKGDTVKVRGTLEKVSSYNKLSYRLVLGDDEDYLLPI